MPAANQTPQLLEIEAASPVAHEPQNESYVIRMRLQGTYEVRSFLSDIGIDEKRIAFAIEELSRTRQAKVKKESQKHRAA